MRQQNHETMHQRTARACSTPGCENKPEPRMRWCLACQLDGSAPLPRMRKVVKRWIEREELR